MSTHGNNLGYDLLVCPLHTKYFGELLEVLCTGFTNAENSIAEPRHTQARKLLVEEVHAKLGRKERKVLDDCKPHTPLFVLCKLNDCREQRL